jgi:hypothetical protein
MPKAKTNFRVTPMQHKYKQSYFFHDTQGGQGKYIHSYCHRHIANESEPGYVSLVTLSENLGPNAIKQIAELLLCNTIINNPGFL